MSRSSNFCSDLCEALQQRIDSHKWSAEWKPLGGSRESVDVAGLPNEDATNNRVILVEIELRREDPASNIIKIWEWFHKGKLPKAIVFFQGFSKVYYSPKHPAKIKKGKNAQFVGDMLNKMSRGIRYFPGRFEYLPYKGAKQGGGARRRAAKRLAKKIAVLWRKVEKVNHGPKKKQR